MDDSTLAARESASPVHRVVLIVTGLIVVLTILGVSSAEAVSVPSGAADDASADSIVSRTDYTGSGAAVPFSDNEVTGNDIWLLTGSISDQEVTFDAKISDEPKAVLSTGHGFERASDANDAPWFADSQDGIVKCTVEPSRIQPGESVTISIEGVGIVADYDLTGDGTWDVRRTDQTVIRVTFNEEGEFTPRVRIWTAAGESAVAECGTVIVSEDAVGIVPPLDNRVTYGVLGLGIFVIGASIWWIATNRGGVVRDREKPFKYQTSTFEIPPSSGPVTIDNVGFEPELLLFRATNRHRSDDATDRTSGWSYGVAVSDDNRADRSIVPGTGTEQTPQLVSRSVTVADDAYRTDQATCASHDDRVLDLIKHGDAEPGRITASVTETTNDGFELDVRVPEDDPLGGGIRVLYQAFQLGTGAATVGHTSTLTEPGIQAVALQVDADHVELVANTGTTEVNRTVTTDRSVGLSLGRAIDHDGSTQATMGVSAWPGKTGDTATTCYDDRIIALLIQDEDRITGRVRARVTGLGDQLSLTADEVDTNPDMGGSTDGHLLTYLAIDSGEELCPAIGTFRFPGPGESTTLDIGFEPGLIELETVAAEPGEERVSRASAQPFDWSYGTATREDDTIVQYVLDQSVAPARTADSADAPPMVPTDVEHASSMTTDGGDEGTHASGRANVGGDGFAASWLVQQEDGRIVGRDDLRVTSITETGFTVAVETVSTDQREDTVSRPTVMYRIWPATGNITASDPEPSVTDEAVSEQE